MKVPDHLSRRPAWKRMHEGGHYSLEGTLFTGEQCPGGQYSLVNNVRGDIIHGGTLFTPTIGKVQQNPKFGVL